MITDQLLKNNLMPARSKPARLYTMFYPRNISRIAAVMLMLCITLQAVTFASPPCAHLDSPDQMMESASCHQETIATDNCCEHQCQDCSMLSATVSTLAVSANSTRAAADRIAHAAAHFYQHTPLPRFRPPLQTL